jgi:beta-phosphoglucomutase-like phosphatase (HAD superfamily)
MSSSASNFYLMIMAALVEQLDTLLRTREGAINVFFPTSKQLLLDAVDKLKPDYMDKGQVASGKNARDLGTLNSPGRFRIYSDNNQTLRNGLNSCRLILSDFDGTQVPTEEVRQRAWLKTAVSKDFAQYFGGAEAFRELADISAKSGRSLFERTIGAPEVDMEMIVKEVSRLGCRFAGVAFNEQAFDFKAFKKARDKFVDGLIERGSIPANRGLFELYSWSRWASIPLCIVTQSKRSFVEKVLGKIMGPNLPTIVSKEDLQIYNLRPKPDPQPYRFASYLMSIKAFAIQIPNIRGISEDNKQRQLAAVLSMDKMGSQESNSRIETIFQDQSEAFKKFLSEPQETLVLEDSLNGLKAGKEFVTFCVSNKVDSIAPALSTSPDKMSELELHRIDSMVGYLREEEKAKIDIAGPDLLSVVDYLRESNPLARAKLEPILESES